MTNCVSCFDMFQCLSTYDTVHKIGQWYSLHAGKVLLILKTGNTVKVCFVVSDNGFSQIFYNCSNVEEIFSWHN